MRYYLMIITVCLSSIIAKAQGQEVTFISPIVEDGIRQHLNISEEEQISFIQLDTITTLDLSRRGITDLRDVILMPNLRTLDLSGNMVEDLRPLTVLESLEWVDLSYNSLKGINDLFYATAKNLNIIVAYNYIKDFSLFTSMSSCIFTLEGMGHQFDDSAPYYDVCHLYTYINSNEKTVISYRGYTNISAASSVKCGATNAPAQLDGGIYTVVLPEAPTETTAVTLTNGEQNAVTYVVPPKEFNVVAGKTVTLETSLPESYHLNSAFASKGTVEIVGNTFRYTTLQPDETDVISFSYYQGSTLKGFSCYNLNIGSILFGDVNNDKMISMDDAILMISYLLGQTPAIFNLNVADLNGDGIVTVTDVIQVMDIINNK